MKICGTCVYFEEHRPKNAYGYCHIFPKALMVFLLSGERTKGEVARDRRACVAHSEEEAQK